MTLPSGPTSAQTAKGGHIATSCAVFALAGNYGARAVFPVVAHIVCTEIRCDAAGLIGSVGSVFFLGDLTAQVASKPLVQRLGGQFLLALGAIGVAASLILVALLVKGPLVAFLAVQLAFGFFCGLGYPAAHALLAEAVPVSCRSTAVSLIVGASSAGTTLSCFATPLIADKVSWFAPFILFILVNTAAGSFAKFLPRTTEPSKTEAASKLSVHFVGRGSSGEMRRWLSDPLIQALVFAMYSSGVANAFLFNFIPTLFLDVYSVQIQDLAMITFLAPLMNSVACLLSGVAADHIINVRGWRPERCRALMQILGTAPPAICLFALARFGSLAGSGLGAALVTVWFAAHGFQTAGQTATFHDVGSLRASELFALGNTFSKLAGVLAGQAFGRGAKHFGWEAVLSAIGVHYVVSGLIFVPMLCRCEQTRRMITGSEMQVETPIIENADVAEKVTDASPEVKKETSMDSHTDEDTDTASCEGLLTYEDEDGDSTDSAENMSGPGDSAQLRRRKKSKEAEY